MTRDWRDWFTRKRVIWLIAIALVLFLFWNWFGPSPTANAAQAPLSTRTYTVHDDGFVTWIDTNAGLCPEYPGGILAGWSNGYTDTGPGPAYFHHYTFGPWNGSFCSNTRRLWDVNWGGRPPGFGSFPWQWHGGDTVRSYNDNVGPYRERRWDGHASAQIVINPHEYPWMRIVITTNGYVGQTNGCPGC